MTTYYCEICETNHMEPCFKKTTPDNSPLNEKMISMMKEAKNFKKNDKEIMRKYKKKYGNDFLPHQKTFFKAISSYWYEKAHLKIINEIEQNVRASIQEAQKRLKERIDAIFQQERIDAIFQQFTSGYIPVKAMKFRKNIDIELDKIFSSVFGEGMVK